MVVATKLFGLAPAWPAKQVTFVKGHSEALRRKKDDVHDVLSLLSFLLKIVGAFFAEVLCEF